MKPVIISQDLSGLGQVSLNVALPLVAALGLQPLTLPTEVLSAHTGGLGKPVATSLADSIQPTLTHWQKLGIKPAGLYLGYLGPQAIQPWQEALPAYQDATVRLVDPAMADQGRLYQGFDHTYVAQMQQLIRSATVITPNLDEAALLLAEKPAASYTLQTAKDLAKRLAEAFQVTAVVTGIPLANHTLAVAGANQEHVWVLETPKRYGQFFGTGDIFASVLFAAMMRGKDAEAASAIATTFVQDAVTRTTLAGSDLKLGLDYAPGLSALLTQFD